MDLSQNAQLAQLLKLSPMVLQSMEILQMNTLELADYLRQTALENPILEEAEPWQARQTWRDMAARAPWVGALPEGDQAPGHTDSAADSLELHLAEQLERRGLAAPLLALCRYLIGLLDDRGRLDQEDLDDLIAKGVPAALLTQGVKALQALDPAGVGARSTEECLLLQLRRLPGEHSLAEALCRNHLALLAKGDEGAVAQALGVSRKLAAQAIRQVRALSPNPLAAFAPAAPTVYLRPDAWVIEEEGELVVYLNQWDLPQFHLSDQYRRLAQAAGDAETADYLRQKLRQARWVLRCVQRRQETLAACLTALVQVHQDYFFGRQEAPGPLLRRHLADRLDLHPSTVTRTLGHKCLQCRQGLFPLSYFFSPARGEVSIQQLKTRIAQAIRAEDPRRPLSDQALTDLLTGEGHTLARRTVTKYRQALGLPPAHQRRLR